MDIIFLRTGITEIILEQMIHIRGGFAYNVAL